MNNIIANQTEGHPVLPSSVQHLLYLLRLKRLINLQTINLESTTSNINVQRQTT